MFASDKNCYPSLILAGKAKASPSAAPYGTPLGRSAPARTKEIFDNGKAGANPGGAPYADPLIISAPTLEPYSQHFILFVTYEWV